MNSLQSRNTQVVSISLSPKLVERLDTMRQKRGQNRSSFIADLISQIELKNKWKQIREWGDATARKYKITSEADVERILQDK